jgi:hypothetical protein
VYGAPTDYNVIGIQTSVGKTWIDAMNHQNPQNIISPELFCHFNHGNSLYSIGIQYSSTIEKVTYSIKHTTLFDTSYQKTDTIGNPFYMKHNNGTIDTIYITKVNTYPRTDTIVTHSKIQSQSILRYITIPLRYGYYIKNGYLRINVGLGIVPTFLVSKITNSDLYLINSNKRVSCLIQPTIEVSYWLYTYIFLHFSCLYQRSIISNTTNNNNKANINNTLASVGISYLFFDKKRE